MANLRGMSYPFGAYSAEVVTTLWAIGVVYSRTTLAHGNFTLPENFLAWHPTCHHKNDLPRVAAIDE